MHRFSVPFGVKAVDEKSIEGLGSVFGNVDLGADVVVQGAFEKSLTKHAEEGTMPAMLWQHQSDQIPGAWTTATETDDGLALKGDFADTQLGRESRTLAKMRAFRGLSIGGLIEDFDFDKRGVRLIKEFDLWEVSLVTFPMNPKAQIDAVKAQFSDPRTLERHLRDVGCSKTAAKEVVHDLLGTGVRPEATRCDAEDEDLVNALRQYNDLLVAGMCRSRLKRIRNG